MKLESMHRGMVFSLFLALTWSTLILTSLALKMHISALLCGVFGVAATVTASLIASYWPEGNHE